MGARHVLAEAHVDRLLGHWQLSVSPAECHSPLRRRHASSRCPRSARGCTGVLAASPNCMDVAGTGGSAAAKATSGHSPSCVLVCPACLLFRQPHGEDPLLLPLRVIILLNKRCKLSECGSVLPRAQHRLPIARRSHSPSIISRPRQVKWDDCHCGEVVKYKMLHLFMKWKFEQPERGALQRVLPRNQPGGLCGAPATGKLRRTPRTWRLERSRGAPRGPIQ